MFPLRRVQNHMLNSVMAFQLGCHRVPKTEYVKVLTSPSPETGFSCTSHFCSWHHHYLIPESENQVSSWRLPLPHFLFWAVTRPFSLYLLNVSQVEFIFPHSHRPRIHFDSYSFLGSLQYPQWQLLALLPRFTYHAFRAIFPKWLIEQVNSKKKIPWIFMSFEN